MKTRHKVHIVLCVALLTLDGCIRIEQPPFATTAARSEIGSVGKQKICIVSFSAENNINIVGGSLLTGLARSAVADKDWQRQLTEKLVEAHFTSTLKEFKKHFTIVAPATYGSVKAAVSLDEHKRIAEAIERANADFGIIARDQFGWTWNPGESGIGDYDVETTLALINKQGAVVWSFHSKSVIYPPSSLEGFASAVTGQTPTDEEIVKNYGEFFDWYPLLVAALVKEDATGKIHKGRFEDYLGKTKLRSRITVFSMNP